MVFGPSRTSTVPIAVEYGEVPLEPCSYTAEVVAIIRLLDTFLDLFGDMPEHDLARSAVLICTDSLSWMSHIARGPVDPGIFIPQIWHRLGLLPNQVSKVAIIHCFSHCGDPRSQIADQKAKIAAKQNKRTDVFWHKDLARVLIREKWEEGTVSLLSNRSQFLHTVLPDTHDFRKRWSLSVDVLPPQKLPLSHVRTLMQIRTGAWPRLALL